LTDKSYKNREREPGCRGDRVGNVAFVTRWPSQDAQRSYRWPCFETPNVREESPPTCSGRWPDASPERETAGSGTETTRLDPTDDAREPDRKRGERTRRGRVIDPRGSIPRVTNVVCGDPAGHTRRHWSHTDGRGSMERRTLTGASPCRGSPNTPRPCRGRDGRSAECRDEQKGAYSSHL